jgi:hypothetical protein
MSEAKHPLAPFKPSRHEMEQLNFERIHIDLWMVKGKDKMHPCTGIEALYRPHGL